MLVTRTVYNKRQIFEASSLKWRNY